MSFKRLEPESFCSLSSRIVNSLLSSGANPIVQNEQGSLPLHWVCALRPQCAAEAEDQSEGIAQLLKSGAVVDAQNSYGQTVRESLYMVGVLSYSNDS
ncbi:hypothetical protein BJX66DRAFT_303200 [Aspergillus keveii]|uniref:Uncharacterized protein n=1 Tax=Aspergillus keveii TaxID=714993 RepID=A0ABR4G6L7_9EURO